MFKWDDEVAREKVIVMAEKNLENCNQFVPPEDVIDFIEKVYDYLTHRNGSDVQ